MNPRKVGFALAGGGPLGAIYELGALAALDEALIGVDLAACDVYVGVSSGALHRRGAGEWHDARRHVPHVHRERDRRRSVRAGHLAAAGVRRIFRPPRLDPGAVSRRPAPISAKRRFRAASLNPSSGWRAPCPRDCSTIPASATICARFIRRRGAPTIFANSAESCLSSPRISTPARRSPSARPAGTTCRFPSRSRRARPCRACSPRSKSTGGVMWTAP